MKSVDQHGEIKIEMGTERQRCGYERPDKLLVEGIELKGRKIIVGMDIGDVVCDPIKMKGKIKGRERIRQRDIARQRQGHIRRLSRKEQKSQRQRNRETQTQRQRQRQRNRETQRQRQRIRETETETETETYTDER